MLDRSGQCSVGLPYVVSSRTRSKEDQQGFDVSMFPVSSVLTLPVTLLQCCIACSVLPCFDWLCQEKLSRSITLSLLFMELVQDVTFALETSSSVVCNVFFTVLPCP